MSEDCRECVPNLNRKKRESFFHGDRTSKKKFKSAEELGLTL